jgi:hypothetical protein
LILNFGISLALNTCLEHQIQVLVFDGVTKFGFQRSQRFNKKKIVDSPLAEMSYIMLGCQVSRISTKAGITRALSTSAVQLAGRQRPGRRSEHPFDVENMEKFNFDDQTTIGHELFDNIREVRKYLRKTKYEIPKLSGMLPSLLLVSANKLNLTFVNAPL